MKTNSLIYSVVNISNGDVSDRAYEISAEVHVLSDNTVKAIHNGMVTAMPVTTDGTETGITDDSAQSNKLASFCDVNGVSINRIGVSDDEYMSVMMAVYQFCQDVRKLVADGDVVIVVHNPNA